MQKNKIYAAYGSNMNIQQMETRCPYARCIGTGILRNYRLVFKGSSSFGGGVASVEPCEKDCVPIVLWETTPVCEKQLDIYEGFPSFYRKEWLPIEVEIRGKKKEIFAYVYVMTDGHQYSKPSAHYLQIIRDGYESAGFDTENLEKAAE